MSIFRVTIESLDWDPVNGPAPIWTPANEKLWVPDGEEPVGNSWLKQMADIFYNGLATATKTSLDITNTSRTLEAILQNVAGDWIRADGASGVDTRGVVLGSSTTTPTRDDVALNTQIADGAGAGQLDHGIMSFTQNINVTGGVRHSMQRTFTNNSGGTITIEEAGVYVGHDRDGGGSDNFMILHDLFSRSMVNLATKVVRYHLDFLV